VVKGIEILNEASMAEGVIEPVNEMLEWLEQFPSESLLELDYGSVADLFAAEQLSADRSAAEIWSCLDSLEAGDFEASARLYTDLESWWSRVKSLETAN
jgi:hypothetical protein